MPRSTVRTSRILAAALLAFGASALPVPAASAAGTTDITAAVLAGANVTLSGDAVVNLPSGTTTYRGQFSGHGTLTVSGSGTLVLTKDSDFSLPAGEQGQSVTTSGGNWPYPIVSNPDRPAVVVARGATLQYGDGGSTGIIGDYPYTSVSSLTLNHDNIEVDGTLVLDISGREYNLGTLSGSGTVSQPSNAWGTLDLAGDLPFSGTLANGTAMNFGSAAFRLGLAHARTIDNDGSAILSARNYTMVLPEDFYESRYGTDINFHTWQAGLIEMTGVDHYVDPAQDTASIAHTSNFRGINIEGAHVQWGDGTTDRFFLPATPSDSYINIHRNGSLAFDYDGPVTLDTPISGGVYHASLSTPANATITLDPTPGNAVTFAVPMNYHGTTTIGRGATLLLGTGGSGGDSSVLTGASNDAIVDDGTLTVRDVSTAVTLAGISGSGGLTQSGSSMTTLSGSTAYTGPTTVSKGTLAIGRGGSGIGTSSSLTLSSPGAVFSIASAGTAQSVRQLTGVAGSRIDLGPANLTVATTGTQSYAGSITGTGGGLTTTGTGTLTLTGQASTPGGAWHIDQGTLAIGPGGALKAGSLAEASDGTLAVSLASAASSAAAAPVQVDGPVQLGGKLTVTAAPAQGGKLVLLHDSTAPISGQFAGLPQGTHITVGGEVFAIDYTADGGHDVALDALSAAPAAGGTAGAGNAGESAAATGASSGIPWDLAGLVGALALALAAVAGFLVKRKALVTPQGRRRRR
jgi:autotransporter-associated beta strand protein